MRWIQVCQVAVVAMFMIGSSSLWGADAVDGPAAQLKPFVESHVLAGAVTLVATPEKVVSLQTVGFADIEQKKPMQPDTLFWIASMSKPMTATAVMMLVDEGKVKLDDPVEKYLPEFRGQMVLVEGDDKHQVLKKPAHPITVREVLSHTSGLPFLSRAEQKIDKLTLAAASISYGMSPLKFEPGTKYDYSNAGINTAGRIVEVVSGQPFEVFMQERLFTPLVMKDTTFWPNEEQLSRLATAYKPNAARDGLEPTDIGQLSYPLVDRQRGPSPAGGYFSTAADCGQFCRMLLNGGTLDGKQYISKASIREMGSTQTGDLLNQGKGEGGYGLGWQTERKANPELETITAGTFGHGGAYSTNMTINPQRKIVTVFLVHHAGFPNGEGGKMLGIFAKAAGDTYGK